jgi:hypothetical protein
VFLRQGYAGYVTPSKVLVVVPITCSLASVMGLKLLLFEGGAGTLLQLQRGVLGLCVLWDAGLLAPAE